MPVKHSSMRQSTEYQQPPTKSYVVDDHSEQPPVQEQAPVEPAPEPVRKPARPMTTEKRNLLEDLLFLGRTTKVVEIEGVAFEIATLTQKETSDMMKVLYASGDAGDLFSIQALSLAFALKSVNGVALEDLDNGIEYEKVLDKKLDILNGMQKKIVETLHNDYILLRDGAEEVPEDEEAQENLKNS